MLGLFFGGRSFQASFGNLYGNVELDAVIDETHEWAVEVTTNPVEFGSPVSDHIIQQPDRLRIRCFVTDAPLNASSSITAFIGSIGNFLSGEGTEVSNRTQAAFDLLSELVKLKLEMTVYTKHRTYTDMVLTNVTVPRSAADGEAIEFSAEFIHIRKVATQLVGVPDGISAKKEAKADASGGAGKKGAESATAKKAEPQKTSKTQPVTTKPSSTLSRVFQ